MLSFKNLVLNPETFELESGEQTLRLGKKEFQIFETLLAHPKKIFTKEELYEAVWAIFFRRLLNWALRVLSPGR